MRLVHILNHDTSVRSHKESGKPDSIRNGEKMFASREIAVSSIVMLMTSPLWATKGAGDEGLGIDVLAVPEMAANSQSLIERKVPE